MPLPGKCWYHITIGTHNSWLPGDPRGFRTRDHRLHSSGDHKHPPPEGEHAGLHSFAKGISGDPVVLPAGARAIACKKLVAALQRHRTHVLIVSVGGMHAHLLVELPTDKTQAKKLIGVAKKSASHSIAKAIPGKVWSHGCGLKPIRNVEHQRNTFAYIARHAEDGAALWTFRDKGADAPSV